MDLYKELGTHPYFYNIFPSMVTPRPNHTCVCFLNDGFYAEIFIPNAASEEIDWFYRPYSGGPEFRSSKGDQLTLAPAWVQLLFEDTIEKTNKMYRLQRLFM